MFMLLPFLMTACLEQKDTDTGTDSSMDTGGEGIDCTGEFVYSLTLTILDDAGAPIDNANISYTVDGEEGIFVEYFTNGEYFVGGEEAGDFVVDIYVEIPDGDDCFDIGTAILNATVEADECHVITQAFEPELDWERVCLD